MTLGFGSVAEAPPVPGPTHRDAGTEIAQRKTATSFYQVLPEIGTAKVLRMWTHYE